MTRGFSFQIFLDVLLSISSVLIKEREEKGFDFLELQLNPQQVKKKGNLNAFSCFTLTVGLLV